MRQDSPRLRPRPGTLGRMAIGAWHVVRALLLVLAALWFLIEEFGWHPLAAWLGRFAEWPPWARVEARIARLPPKQALFLFLVPVVLLFPVKLLALELMHGGRPVLGLVVIVAAKLVGTAIGGRLYLLMRPQLMRIPRFARFIAMWRWTRLAVRRHLRTTLAWARWATWRGWLRDCARRWRRWRHG